MRVFLLIESHDETVGRSREMIVVVVDINDVSKRPWALFCPVPRLVSIGLGVVLDVHTVDI